MHNRLAKNIFKFVKNESVKTAQNSHCNKHEPIVLNWENETPPKPTFLGIKVFEDYSLEELSHYIDWTPFFKTWSLSWRYPNIFDDKVIGTEARQLYQDAQVMLAQITQVNQILKNSRFNQIKN